MKVFVFAVGAIDPFEDREAADRAVEFIRTLPGFVGVHPNMEYTLLCFDTLEHAQISRGMWTETGNVAGAHIMHGEIMQDDGTLFIGEPADLQ